MKMVYTPLWQNVGNKRSGLDFVQEEVELMVLVEELGFDYTFSPEHHFDIDYSACPDQFLPLSYVAARTTTLGLGLGAVILPWNEPLRVVEKISMLDHLSNGRLVIGFGRGLSKIEYAGMGVSMDESRARFNESARMVLNAIRTGFIEGDGPFYPQPRVEVHPKPRPGLAEGFYSVAMSPDSAVNAAEISGQMLCFTTAQIEAQLPMLDSYRENFQTIQGRDAPAVALDDFFYVHDGSPEEASKGREYAKTYYKTVVRHYSLNGDHFAGTKGYESYAAWAVGLEAAGIEASAEAYADAQVGLGTPEEVIEKFRHRVSLAGEFEQAGAFFYGGMTQAEARASLELFSREVLPEFRRIYDAQNARVPEGANA